MMRVVIARGVSRTILLPILLLLALFSPALAQQYKAIDTRVQPLSNKICATCHGAYGQGNSVVGAPSLAGMEPWYLRSQLIKFRAAVRGVPSDYIPGYEMRAAVAELSDAEMDEVIAYIETWSPAASEAAITGDTARGAELYGNCVACHGAAGQGAEALKAPGLAGRDDWYLRRQLKLFQSGYRGRHPEDIEGAQMRAAAQLLKSEKDIDDVLAHISTLN
ncbi:MAG: c-type cytochrome [Pseudohongiellaceae bacterium]